MFATDEREVASYAGKMLRKYDELKENVVSEIKPSPWLKIIIIPKYKMLSNR